MNNFSAAQKRAIETLDRNMAVKAGAGAGKTRVLVERYMRILESGAATLDGIVAITFTRKAAREMKDRIRDRIRNRADGDVELDQVESWRKVARNFDVAAISTIHSLCSRILREHPAEAGVDPEFAMLDDMDADQMLHESWHGALDRAAIAEPDWLKHLLAVYSPAQIRQDFFALFEAYMSTGYGEEPETLLAPNFHDEGQGKSNQLRDAYLRVFALLPEGGKGTATQERLKELRAGWHNIEEKLLLIPGEPQLLDQLEQSWKGLRSGGELGEAIRAWKTAAANMRESLLDTHSRRLIPDVCELFRQAADAYRQAKKLRRSLTYDDLESRTEQLLGDWPDICAAYHKRIRFIMVDECQDINERQRKIIYLLAGGKVDELRQRGLFVVGDLKQSIYRFRGADNRVFSRIERDICASGGEVVELLDNYRSHQGLIAAFNEFFSELMPAQVCEGEETRGLDVVEYRHLQGNKGEKGEERLDLWVLDGDLLSGADVHEKEAEMIAGRIRRLVAEADSSVQYGDIAILLRAFSRINTYEAALAKLGIPYYVVGGRGMGERQEIQDALGLLRFLCNRRNEMALFGLLRSPFFLLSDEALFRLRSSGKDGGIWAALAAASEVAGLSPDEQKTALQARNLLERLLEVREFLTPAELLREAFDATGFDLFQLTQLAGARRYANLQKLLAMARTFSVRESKNLPAFLQYVEMRMQEEGEAEIDSEAGNTVRIMTIHKSKGLEFPVVIVPDLQRKFSVRSQLGIFLRGYGMGLKTPDPQGNLRESGDFRRIAGMNAAMERAEMKRLLYVAMTRAEKQIILSAVAKRAKAAKTMQKASGWLDWAKIMFGLPEEAALWPTEVKLGGACLNIRLGMTDAAETSFSQVNRTLPKPAGGELPSAVQRKIASLSVGKTRPMVLSPAYLAEFEACPRSYYYSHIARFPDLSNALSGDPGNRTESLPAAGRFMGIAFHRVLELMHAYSDWSEAMWKAIQEKIPPELQEDAAPKLQHWITRYLESSLAAESLMAAEERREWAFHYKLLPEEELLPIVWLSGQIDRVLFQSDGSLGIVDYKTDWVMAGDLYKKAAHYRLQLAGYALGAGAAFGRTIQYARLYFARTGEHIDADVGTAILLSARQELQNIADFIRRHEQEGDYECRLSHCKNCRHQRICLSNS